METMKVVGAVYISIDILGGGVGSVTVDDSHFPLSIKLLAAKTVL